MALTLNASDNFNRANSELVGATMSDGVNVWGSNDSTTGVYSVSSNQCYSGAGSWSNIPLYNSSMSVSTTDQAAEIKIVSTAYTAGPVVRSTRVGGTGGFYYIQIGGTSSLTIYYATTGYPGTVLGVISTTIANGDIVKLEAIGTTLTVYINGASVGSVTDSNLSAGRCGIWNAFGYYCDDYNDYTQAIIGPTIWTMAFV